MRILNYLNYRILNKTIWIILLLILFRAAASTWTGYTYSFFYGGYNTRYFDDQSIYVPEFWNIQDVQLIYFDVQQSAK